MLQRLRRRRRDEGFGVVEVLVALSLLGVVAAAVLPVVVLGTGASAVARDRTQAKNLATGQLEQLRVLPYYVARESQPTGSSVDLLDLWFPSTSPAGSLTSSGYVPAGSTSRAEGEPTSGAYYRTYSAALPGAASRFSQTVTVQFLQLQPDGQRAPVAPAGTYSATTVGADAPPTRLAEVRVLLRWTYGGTQRSERLVSQLTDAGNARATLGQAATGQAILAQARATALRVLDATTVDEVTAQVGAASADGVAGSVSTANGAASAAVAGPFSGASGQGAAGSSSAPPDSTTTTVTGAAWTTDGTCSGACFGPSSAPGQTSQVVSGLPSAGGAGTPSTTNPVVSVLARRDLCGSTACSRLQRPFAFNGRLLQDTARDLDYVPDDGYGAVTLVEPASGDAARGTAVVTSTAGTGAAVRSAAGAALGRVDVLPTRTTRLAGAGGLVRVTLQSASLSCSASSTAQTASAGYQGVLSYWGRLSTGSYGYTDVAFELSAGVLTGGALPALDTVVVSEQVVDGTTVTRRLSDYVHSITFASAPSTAVDGSTRGVRSSITPMRVSSKPLGTTGSESTLSLELGALSCVAQDSR